MACLSIFSCFRFDLSTQLPYYQQNQQRGQKFMMSHNSNNLLRYYTYKFLKLKIKKSYKQKFKKYQSPQQSICKMKTKTRQQIKKQQNKKATLLRQKILTNSSIMHNTYQYRIEQLLKQQEQWKLKINDTLIQFSTKIEEIQNRYKANFDGLHKFYVNNQSGEQNNNFWRLSIEQIKKYLNSQKNMLKQLLQQKQEQPNKQIDKIHNLVKKRHLQQILEQVQLHQLQKQVKYLSTHVINSSGLIYIPENTISQAEQQQLNKKLQLHLSQAKRLIQLQITCGRGNKNGREDQQKKGLKLISALQSQQKRLNKVFQLLNQQRQGVHKIDDSINQYLQISSKTPKYNQKQTTKQSHSLLLQKPAQQTLDNILKGFDLDQYGDIVSNQTCTLEQFNNSIKTLRNRLKKIQ